MKTKDSSVWILAAAVVLLFGMTSCGNSQKKRERAAEKRMTTQPMDRATVIESETVVISVDSVAPDTVNVGR